MSTKYHATEYEYRTIPLCRACHDAGQTEAETIALLAKEVERLTKELIKERSEPPKLLFISRSIP